MIKTSSEFIKFSLEKLFNLILKSGVFPTSWSNGIITALHKSGNKDDPSNYRGICISSCLGKLFCSILNTRLLKYNIGGTFYKIISNMYSHSKCCVKDNNNRSEFFNYDKGVRQGCILSPLLFSLYLNELPYILNNNAKDPILLPDGSHLNCLLYADDLLLTSHSAESLYKVLTDYQKILSGLAS